VQVANRLKQIGMPAAAQASADLEGQLTVRDAVAAFAAQECASKRWLTWVNVRWLVHGLFYDEFSTYLRVWPTPSHVYTWEWMGHLALTTLLGPRGPLKTAVFSVMAHGGPLFGPDVKVAQMVVGHWATVGQS